MFRSAFQRLYSAANKNRKTPIQEIKEKVSEATSRVNAASDSLKNSAENAAKASVENAKATVNNITSTYQNTAQKIADSFHTKTHNLGNKVMSEGKKLEKKMGIAGATGTLNKIKKQMDETAESTWAGFNESGDIPRPSDYLDAKLKKNASSPPHSRPTQFTNSAHYSTVKNPQRHIFEEEINMYREMDRDFISENSTATPTSNNSSRTVSSTNGKTASTDNSSFNKSSNIRNITMDYPSEHVNVYDNRYNRSSRSTFIRKGIPQGVDCGTSQEIQDSEWEGMGGMVDRTGSRFKGMNTANVSSSASPNRMSKTGSKTSAMDRNLDHTLEKKMKKGTSNNKGSVKERKMGEDNYSQDPCMSDWSKNIPF